MILCWGIGWGSGGIWPVGPLCGVEAIYRHWGSPRIGGSLLKNALRHFEMAIV